MPQFLHSYRLLAFVTAVALGFFAYQYAYRSSSFDDAYRGLQASLSVGKGEDRFARFTWENRRLVAPDGSIPEAMRRHELDFARQLRQKHAAKGADAVSGVDSLEWVSRGPYNMGGRTRAFAMDIANPNILLAGGVSGGMFRSTDAGLSWTKVSDLDDNQAITCLVQDRRPGYTHTWYYGTGEAYGNSASGTGAGSFYLGDGVYKSTDNGLSWEPLNTTDNGSPNSFSTEWQLVWNVATDNSNTADQAEVYVASYGRIFRSANGGNTFSTELNGGNAYFTNVAVTSTGVVYATISSDGTNAGVWRSEDGMTWTQIKPANFPANYDRTAIGINPSNENEVYFLMSNTVGSGKTTYDFRNEPEENSFWRYNYVSGDGAGAGGTWTDLSANLPIGPYAFDDFIAQGGYDLVVVVKPDEPNVVFIGGTNIYRSTDGFTSSDNTTFMGGYDEDTELPLFTLYPVQHPDQHVLFFDSANPNILFSGNDGGLYRTDNCMATSPQWTSLNNGYVTTQYYTIAIDHAVSDNLIIGGLQDNGTRYVNTSNPTQAWTMPFNYDGSYCAVPSGRDYMLMSINGGAIVKVQVDDNGQMSAFERIDPEGANADRYQFINPFAADPTNNDIIYLSEGYNLWVNTDVSAIPIANNYEKKTTNWFKNNSTIADTTEFISAIEATTLPQHRLYLGTSAKRVYRIENSLDPNSPMIDITPISGFPSSGYVSCVESDPRDGNKVFVVFSNYGVYSLFYSVNGGETWVKAAGNLEQFTQGTGNGPSVRAISILPLGADSTAYFVGTSVGLFHTSLIDTLDTEWTQVALTTVGTTVVEAIEARQLDGLIAVATHGNGVFTANTPQDPVSIAPPPTTQTSATLTAQISPNPCTDGQATLLLQVPEAMSGILYLYNMAGQQLRQIAIPNLPQGKQQISLSLADLPPGTYLYQVQNSDQHRASGKLLVW